MTTRITKRIKTRITTPLVAIFGATILITGCGSQVKRSGGDPTQDAGYARTAEQLTGMDRQAEQLFAAGKADEASAIIQKGLPLMDRLVSVPRPTLAALEAASDLDDLYGRMLLSNRHYGWARLQFQKNVARWKHWTPETPESVHRFKQALAEIDDCDRRMTQ